MTKRVITFSENKKHIQKFEKNPTFIKYGKKIRIQDYINENAEEVNIEETLRKYGAIPKENISYEEVITDLTQIQDLRSLQDKRNEIKKIFYTLPPEIRKSQFKDDVYLFEQNGLKYFQEEQIKKIQKVNEYLKKQEELKKKGGNDDGTKK